MVFGVVTGLIAALCQALVYLATRHYVQRREGKGSRELLTLAHIWMGIFSLVTLPFVWQADLVSVVWSVRQPVLLASLFYVLAQFSLVLALKHAEASRVSPLLGLKIVILAVFASFVEQPHRAGVEPLAVGLTWLQWVAVLICVVSAAALNFSGVRLRRRAIVAVLAACLFYSLADWNITLVVLGLEGQVQEGRAPVLTAVLMYGICGVLAVGFLPAYGTRDKKAWRDSLPFAVLWFVGMLFLFACFGELGPLLGSILQSSRGLISIVMGSVLMHWGHFHLEPLSAKGVMARRFAAGVLMFLAVTLYVIREPGRLMMVRGGGGGEGVSHEHGVATQH